MNPSDILPLLTGPAAAVAVLVWVVYMQRQDIKDMRRALDAANERANSSEDAARTTLAALQAITGTRDGGAGPGVR